MNEEAFDAVDIVRQCPASWRKMKGDDRVRFCSICNKNVYNLSNMTQDEAYQVIADTEGKFCSRFLRRPDGTIVTRDCPTLPRSTAWGRAALGSILSLLGLTAASSMLATKSYAGATTATSDGMVEAYARQIRDIDRYIGEERDPKEKEELREYRTMLLSHMSEAAKHNGKSGG
jgi:hypothetical protein